jgi:hypothetical protein
MTITECITSVYLRSVGKATPPASTSSKYTRIVGLLDFYQRRWSRENDVDWASLYDPSFSIGAVTATDTFDLDTSSIRKLSDREGDSVRIVWTDGVKYTDYDIVDADMLKDYYYNADKSSYTGFVCAQIGSTLVFNHKFASTDPQYGGDIQVPCYTFTDPITSDNPDSDEVQVDDPDWLVTRAAAEYVRNDITRRQRYPELLQEANEIMDRMKDDNEGQLNLVNRPWRPFSGLPTDSAWS